DCYAGPADGYLRSARWAIFLFAAPSKSGINDLNGSQIRGRHFCAIRAPFWGSLRAYPPSARSLIMGRRSHRREFLKQTGLAGIGFWVAGSVTLAPSKSPNHKLNFACIGVGGKGSSDTDHVGKLGTVVALCDIDDNTLDRKAEKFPKAKKYNDYRTMLEEMGKQIDAVTVSTPDHTHAPAAIMA